MGIKEDSFNYYNSYVQVSCIRVLHDDGEDEHAGVGRGHEEVLVADDVHVAALLDDVDLVEGLVVVLEFERDFTTRSTNCAKIANLLADARGHLELLDHVVLVAAGRLDQPGVPEVSGSEMAAPLVLGSRPYPLHAPTVRRRAASAPG